MKTKNLVLMSLFAAITVVCAQIVIPTSLVPFSLSLFAVFLTGAILDKRDAFLAQLVYVMIGIVGLPVFANLRGGFEVIAGPTGGYIVAYPIMAYLVALSIEKLGNKSIMPYLAGMLAALIVCYSLGAIWLGTVTKMGFVAALYKGVIPFIVFDLIKIILSASVGVVLNEALVKAGLYEKA